MGPSGEGQTQTFISCHSAIVNKYPNVEAIVSMQQPAGLYDLGDKTGRYLRVTYRQLYDKSRLMSRYLTKIHALPPATPMFLFLSTGVELYLSTVAGHHAGFYVVPIAPSTLVNSGEAIHMMHTVIEELNAESAIVVVDDHGLARRFDAIVASSEEINVSWMRIIVDGHPLQWRNFAELLIGNVSPSTDEPCEAGTKVIMFTSGTTTRPKAVIFKMDEMADLSRYSVMGRCLTAGDKTIMSLPGNHSFSYICSVTTLTLGVTMVLPSKKFSPLTFLNAIEREQCVHAALVPAMMLMVLEAKEESKDRHESFKYLTLAGAISNRHTVERFMKAMDLEFVENLFGMTEGAFTSTGPMSRSSLLFNQNDLSVGLALGGEFRICDTTPERNPLPPLMPGEIHFTGATLVDGYIGGKEGNFYEFEGKRWFGTGDQGYMDREGRAYILGRFSDVIIRGGENIALAKIESFLMGLPNMRQHMPQCVGISDRVAGQVPAVVWRTSVNGSVFKSVQKMIKDRVGEMYVPHTAMTLEELGLEDFPRTVSGKLKRQELTQRVAEFISAGRRNMSKKDIPRAQIDLRDAILKIWASTLGLSIADLDVNALPSSLGDSLVQMSVRGKIRHATGRKIPLEQWLAAPTLEEQITMLTGKNDRQPMKRYAAAQQLNAPVLDDITHLEYDEESLQGLKQEINNMLKPDGLSYEEDVQFVFPCTDFMQIVCKDRDIDIARSRTVWVSRDPDLEPQKLRLALEITLQHYPTLISYMLLKNNSRFDSKDLSVHVVLKQSRRVLDLCIKEIDSVDGQDLLNSWATVTPFETDAKFPGPLLHAYISRVKGSNSPTLFFHISHAVMDATLMARLHGDLEHVLKGTTPTTDRVPFKIYADMYYAMRHYSPGANASTNYAVKSIKNIMKLDPDALSWTPATSGFEFSTSLRDQCTTLFPIPDLAGLKRDYRSLSAPLIMKAATALLVMALNKTKHSALMGTVEANRRQFPFLPASRFYSDGIFDEADVAGPTWTIVPDAIVIRPKETVIDFLCRLAEEQKLISKYATTPWYRVFKECPQAEDIYRHVLSSLHFNWISGLGEVSTVDGPPGKIKLMESSILPVGSHLLVNCNSVDHENFITIHLTGVESESAIGHASVLLLLTKIALWLTKAESRQKLVADVFNECF